MYLIQIYMIGLEPDQATFTLLGDDILYIIWMAGVLVFHLDPKFCRHNEFRTLGRELENFPQHDF